MDTFKRLKDFYLPYKKYFFWSLISLLGVTGMTVVYPIILQMSIDSVTQGEYGLIPWLVLALLVATLIKSITAFINQYYGDLFGISSVYQLRKALYKKLQFLPFKYYDNAKTGDLMSRLTADVEGFRFFLSFGFAQLVNFVLLVTFSLAVMFYYSVPLTLLTMATLPFLCVTVYMFDKRVHPRFRKIRKSLANLNTKVQENVSGVQTVKALSQEDEESKRFDVTNEDYRTKHIDIARVWGKYFPLMETIGNMASVILIGFGGYLTITNSMTAGEFVAFFSLIGFIIGPIMQLGFIMNTFSQSKASGERLLEILDAKERVDEYRSDKEKVRLIGEVKYENVDLAYNTETNHALTNISFEAKKGQTIGLVGATGSGKSSVIQLLTRFYQKTDGEIFIDGKPIEQYSMKQIRSNIGIVLQETFLFSSTIRDNISYGVAGASMDDIIAAAKRADAHEFISELPEGYDTVLGERGLGLSGGQKQRIAIARAILMDPAILIMDDATSAVDMQTEVKIQKAFREVMEGRTTFIIAHRISSVKHADQILVLDQGQIVERGTHDELLENEDGIYRRIYNIQNQDQQYVLQQA
ncbi:multidrug ABC transporter ATP-binding protein [Alkalihalobacillus alcalophilus ATCC 27647 = CGMCC 1.3604]|uniref:Multidrug ABC transporter ATP-binding protein n=1 Tax=Alkalihalobacillus alcalophilus ATCC 27647 = CGMCC 1.3604 TaxID=1218173 RepID=J8Q6F6_ALKAL|nr:ABC transporter ATP-binding protein [Alkalihalobacillus alcalophilus]AFV25889.1 multidrug transporter [Alkalihalobacillus alcalophilus ATCC 27647 = CGMCC 1.3604]KGA98040.1 multidrug ABC transporter ATP-binding protein [Alkalihalobacillus alcalophilus ATCC 27647 = CGMCC 1.3604]MED1561902.1 ABC transporter ATP-binding protein [Alkalihalobacillus alcalophilus]THG89585.1 multidrug ABC transporter ATP-binding protein [Alkalihalobacillus alcalophilus ATCC 27647 = CGMCC 1.3604]